MSGRNSKTIGAAIAAAPTSVPSQTAATAGEAGVPLVPTSDAKPADNPADESADEPASTEDSADQPQGFTVERFTQAIESLDNEQFEAALEAMHAEAHIRGIISDFQEEEEEEQDDEPEGDEHEATRELLARFKLPRAWQDATGTVHFDEAAALKVAGDNPDSITVIEA